MLTNIETSLFEGQRIRLAPIDHEKDPQVEARWTNDASYLRGLISKPARPRSPAQVKKRYEAIEKEVEESKNTFYFTIRRQEDQALLGFVHLYWIEWTHGNGNLRIAIGDPQERRKGYASEALGLALRYAFTELNLFRLSTMTGEDNPAALRLFQKFGFVEEARRRKALLSDGQTYDLLHMGLLRQEWLEGQNYYG